MGWRIKRKANIVKLRLIYVILLEISVGTSPFLQSLSVVGLSDLGLSPSLHVFPVLLENIKYYQLRDLNHIHDVGVSPEKNGRQVYLG